MLQASILSNEAFTEKMITFLQTPASYPHTPARVEIKQTHASILAIAPPYVYKVKKHVNLGFMDFTSLASRKTNAEREIGLNSRLCPSLYVGIIPVTEDKGQLSFNGKGTIVDYALQMHQLEDGFFLHQLLAKGEVDEPFLEAILEKLATFYRGQAPKDVLQEYGSLDNIRGNVSDNLKGIEENGSSPLARMALPALRSYATSFMNRHASLFEKRKQQYCIKDCHGDLHLDHVHVKDGQITIYDCIEFNDHFRYSDVAADIAFLAMDLDFHHRPDLSSFVTQGMATLLKDPDMLKLMDFYICYRACVRAKVAAIQASEKEVQEQEKHQAGLLSDRYLRLALRYAVLGSKPRAVMVCGRAGSGKSTLARKLAEAMDVFYLGSDEVRKQQAGLPLYSRTEPEKRKSLYAPETSEALYQTLLQTALQTTAHQQHIVIDATFSQRSYRKLFTEAFEQQHIPYLFIEMQTSDQTIRQRLASREHQAQEVSDARLEDFEKLSRAYQPPVEIPPLHLIQVDSGQEVEALVSAVVRQLIQLVNAG